MRKIVILMAAIILNVSMAKAQTTKSPVQNPTTSARNSSNGVQVKKTRWVENGGYIWYELRKGNLYGAQDIDGNIIVPIRYSNIHEMMGYENAHFFLVEEGDFKGAYTPSGVCVIPTERHYTEIKLYYECEKAYWVVKKNGATGVLDAKGQVIIALNEMYTDFRMGRNKDDGIRYFSSRRGDVGDGFQGVFDLNGTEIITADKYTWVFYNPNGKSYAIMGKGDSEKRIELPKLSIPQYTKFDYALFGGLYCGGRTDFGSNSSSTHSSPNSDTSPSSPSSNDRSGSNTTTVIVEHHNDPVPVQQWQACFGCGGMGTMGCDNCGGSGTKYIGDRLHRCSRCNGRGIIPCNVCYGNKGQYITVYR